MERSNTGLLEANPTTLEALRATINGDVFTPEDEGYHGARHAWNLAVDQSPLLVVAANDVADIQAALAYARANNLPVAVQSTGHGIPRCCNGALLIRTGKMDAIEIDAQSRTARIGAGAKWEAVLNATQKVGLAGLSGSTPDVGVVGYMVGGGFGLMTRKYGLAIDTLRSFKMVTANGDHLTASARENADLFWAFQGGGGGFGVVTEVEIDLLPEPEIFGGAILYPHEKAPEIFRAYLEWCETAPDEATTSISLMTFPHVPFVPEPLRGLSAVIINACVCGDLEKAEETLAPLRNLGEPIMEMFAAMPYAANGVIYRDPVDPVPAKSNGVLIKDLDAEAIETFLLAMGPIPEAPTLKVEIRHLGGAMHRNPNEAAAIGNRREAKYLLHTIGIPVGPGVPEKIDAHAERIFDAMAKYTLSPGPLNFLGEGNVDAKKIRSLYADEDYARLVAIKKATDPQNRFPFAGIGITVAEGL